MTVQDVEQNKPKTKSVLGLPSFADLDSYKKTGQFTPGADTYVQSEEDRLKEEEFQKKGALGKMWTGLQQFWYGNLAGLQYGGVELAPILTKIPAVALGARMLGKNRQEVEDALIASEVYKDKARENLDKANAIYGHGFWNEVGKAAPFVASALASGGLGLAGEAAGSVGMAATGTALRGAATLASEGTLGALLGSTYGSSLMESDMYEEMTGKQVPVFQKQADALVSTAAMMLAFRLAGSSVNKIGDAYSNVMKNVLRDNPGLTSSLVGRFIAETPGAAAKLMAIGKQSAAEGLKVGGGMGLMTLTDDFLKNLEKYPEDRLAFSEIVKNTVTSFKSGAFLGAMIGPVSAGIGEGYHYFRRKQNGVNLLQTADGKVYEKVADKDAETYTVIDKNLRPKDIKKSEVIDQVNMTKPELDQALDAYRTNSDALPKIEEGIYTNYAKKSAQDLARQITTFDDKGNAAIVFMTDKDGHTYFQKKLSMLSDGMYAIVGRVEKNPETGELAVKDQMVKITDQQGKMTNGWQISGTATPDEFVQRGVDAYRAKKGWIPGIPGEEPVKDDKTGMPLDPVTRQQQEDAARKVAKEGDKITYQGREFEVMGIGFDGSVKAVELKDGDPIGEYIEIKPDQVDQINDKKFKEPTEDLIPAEGAKVKPGTPVYLKDGVPVSKGEIKGVMSLATDLEQTAGYTWENDKELDKLKKKKFPDSVQNWFIDGKEVTPDEVRGAISVIRTLKDAARIKIQHDPELEKLLADKIALITPVEKPKEVTPKVTPAKVVTKEPGRAPGLEVPGGPQAGGASETAPPPVSEEFHGEGVWAGNKKAKPVSKDWKMTREEFWNLPENQKIYGKLTGKDKDAFLSLHKIAVEEAIKEGKPVPKEVLAEYPDLKPSEKYQLNDMTFDTKDELFEYLDENAVNENGTRKVDFLEHKAGLPEPNVIKAINEWSKKYPVTTKPIEEKPTEVTPEPIGISPENAVEELKTTPVYHGTFANFEKFDPEKLGTSTGAASAKQGFFFATNPTIAASYASKTRKRIDEIKPEMDKLHKEITDLTGDTWIQAAHKLIQLEVNKTPAYSPITNGKVRDILDKLTALEDELQSFDETWMNDQVELADEGNLKKVYLDIKNPFIKDYEGSDFRDEPYAKVIADAKEAGHDAVIFKNTFDGGDPAGNLYPTDVIVVFSADQIKTEPVSTDVIEGGLKSADEIAGEIEEARKDVEPAPTEGQKEAGNYPKGHISVLGMDISIETAKGGIRSGTDRSGKEWSIEMKNDYGHILGTEAADGDLLDVFIGEIKPDQNIYIIDQVRPGTKIFDEHKVMLGFDNGKVAKDTYLSNYEEGWTGFGAMSVMPIEQFKNWAFTKGTYTALGTKRLNQPLSKSILPRTSETEETEETEAPTGPTPAVIEGMAKIKEREKLDRQRAVQENKLFQEQKTRLLDDLIKAEDILLGKNKKFVREHESEYPDKMKDSMIVSQYEYKIEELPENIKAKLSKLGIRVKDGKLVIDIYKDGTVEVGDLRKAMEIIDKGFPKRITERRLLEGPSKPKGRQIRAIAESLGSLEEAQRRVKAAEQNIKEANTPGLKKIMQEYLDEAKTVLAEAKDIDYEGIALKTKISGDEEFLDLFERISDRIYFYDLNKAALYEIIEKNRPAELTVESVLPLIVQNRLDEKSQTLDERIKEVSDEIQNKESELTEKFGHKDGKGLRKPKNNREEYDLRYLNSAINRLIAELEDLETVKPKLNVKGKTEEPIRPAGPERGKGTEDIIPGGTETAPEPTPPKGPAPEFAGETVKYIPHDEWDKNLIKARMYAAKGGLFDPDELAILGKEHWTDLDYLVKAIKAKLGEPAFVGPPQWDELTKHLKAIPGMNTEAAKAYDIYFKNGTITDPQNFRIHLMSRVNPIITDYWVNHFQQLRKDYGPIEITADVIEKVTDMLQKQFLPQYKTMGELIQQINQENISQLMSGGRAGVLKPESEVKLEAWSRYINQFAKPTEFAGEKIETVQPQVSVKELSLTHRIPIGAEGYDYPNKALEPVIKRDVTAYAKEVGRVLGWEHETDKKGKIVYSHVNLPPAGGEATFKLFKPGSDIGIYVKIPYEPTEILPSGEYGSIYSIQGTLEKQGFGPILYRLTSRSTGKDNANHWIGVVDAGEMANQIRKLAESFEKATPEVIAEKPMTAEQKIIEQNKKTLPNMSIGRRGAIAYKSILKAIPILPQLKPGDYYRSGERGDAIMPFSIEAVPIEAGQRIFPDPDAYILTLAHTYEQMGDLMWDPRIDVAVYPAYGIVIPVYYTMSGLGIAREYVVDGKIDEKGMNDTFAFIPQWMNNIVAQGRSITGENKEKILPDLEYEQRPITDREIIKVPSAEDWTYTGGKVISIKDTPIGTEYKVRYDIPGKGSYTAAFYSDNKNLQIPEAFETDAELEAFRSSLVSDTKEPKSPQDRLVDMVKTELEAGQKITNTPQLVKIAEAAGMKIGEHYTDIKELYDIASLALNRYINEVGERFNPFRMDQAQAKNIVEELINLQDLLPTETQRSRTQVELQQYSTPPALAFLSNWIAEVGPGDTMLEPSAGEGNIAIFAKNTGARVVVNEYDQNRINLLKMLGFDKITKEDAKYVFAVNSLKSDKITVVVMNPPFSKDVALGGKMDLHGAEKHISGALKKLEPEGRLVAIVGKGMGFDSPTHREWWDKIKKGYNVKANILISGDAYAKKGTSFDNRLVVIDKTGETPQNAVILTGYAENYSDLTDLLAQIPNKVRNFERDENVTGYSKGKTAPVSRPGEPTGPGPATTDVGGIQRGDTGQPGPIDIRPAGDGKPDTGPSDINRQGGTQLAKPGGPGQVGGGISKTGTGGDSRKGKAGPGRGGIVRGNAGPTGGLPEQYKNKPGGEIPGRGISVVRLPKSEAHNLTNRGYDKYTPEITIEGAKDHPTPLVESSAMASVPLPETDYSPALAKSTVDSGALSSAQLEDIILAGNANEQILPSGERRGFFLGAGTGYGKGRTIAGILLDNWNKGQTKGVWISINDKAHRDSPDYWTAVGGDEKVLIKTTPNAKGPIKIEKGILLTTYGTVRSKFNPKLRRTEDDLKNYFSEPFTSRVQQLAQWLGRDFSGVIVFDESHNMANAISTRGTRGRKKPSNTALAGMELQRMLPNAKIIYSSATGATEVSNLVYAQRLGLWGDGTAFEKADDFINAVDTAGVSGMEIISKDLKSMGLYTAKTLSFDGVEYDTLRHNLVPAQVNLYNQVADAWQIVLKNINAAIEVNETSKEAKAAAMSAFWGAHQRFFGQIINAMQMPTLIKDIQKNLDEGNAVVVQLVNTNEMQLERALAEAREESEGELDLEDLDLSPKSIILDFLYNSFPVQQFQEATDQDGNIVKVPVIDSEGKPVLNPESVAKRDKLLEELDKSIVLPEAPIDMLLNTFGIDNVAEATGRGKRVVLKPGKDGKLTKQEETRTDSNVKQDVNNFMDGEKNMLIFSKAGGTGASYHSDLSRKNQKRRVHYVLQAGWQADAAIQGFGRSHRSNQRVPPLFKLVTTDLRAQRRFLSSIARRLEQLGALTKGQRDTGGAGVLDGSYNLEGRYAKQALFEFYQDVENGRVPGVDMATLEDQMALKIYREDQSGTRVYNENVIFNTKQFLNRLMSLRVDLMDKVFDGFINKLDEEVNAAILSGSYDAGIENVKAEKIRVVDEQLIYTDPRTKGKTYITTFELTLKNDKRDWKRIMAETAAYDQLGRFMGYYQEKNSGKIYAMVQQRIMDADGSTETKIKRMSVIADHHIDYRELREKYNELKKDVAKEIWDKDFAEYPDFRNRTETIVKGLILPIWNRLPNNISVKRYIDEKGQAHLGRYFPPKDIQRIVKDFEVASTQKYSPEQIKKIVKDGGMVRMANGFEFTKGKYQGIPVIKIENTRSYRDGERLERSGATFVVSSSMTMAGDYYISMDKASDVISEIERLFGTTVVHAEDSDGNFIMAKPEGPAFMRRPKDLRGEPSIWEDPRFKRYELAPGEFAEGQMKALFESEVIRRARIMMAHSNVNINVVKTKADLPQELQDYAIRQFGDLSSSEIPSVYDRKNKVIYIVVEDTKSISDLTSNMAHEVVAHYGLERLLGKDAYLDVLKLTYRGMSPVDAVELAARYKVDPEDWKTIAEEYIGDTAGAGKMNPSLWQRIITKIREWIRKLFNIPMSKAEIIVLLNKSREALRRNKYVPEPTEEQLAGDYMKTLTGFAARKEPQPTKHAYGIKVSGSQTLETDIAKGNQDYQTYFAAATPVIGSKAVRWIERAMVRAGFDQENIVNYLNSKILRYKGDDKLQKPFIDALEYVEANPPMKPEPLYQVMIGKGKTPNDLNLIDKDHSVTEDNMESIMNQLDVEGKFDPTFNYRNIQSGADLYRKMVGIYGSDREASLALSRAGIDGMRFIEQEMGNAQPFKVDSYIIFDNTPIDVLNQIAFKRRNKPVFAGEHIARAGQRYTLKQTKRNWNKILTGMREFIQDMDLPIRKFEEEVLKRGGFQTNEMKPYRDKSLTFGRQETLYKEFLNLMEGVTGTSVKISQATGLPIENVLAYTIAKHAPERNLYLRTKEFDEIMKVADPNLTQAEIDEIKDFLAQKDYAGVMQFDTDEAGVALGNYEYPDELAKVITDEFESVVPDKMTKELWSNIRKASTKVLDYWEMGEQISPEMKQEYLDRYNYFVPLRGWRHGYAKYLRFVRGQGVSRSLIHAEGRQSLADNPFVYLQETAFKAIGEMIDNEVKTAMLKLIMRNLSSSELYDMVTIKKLYYVANELPDGTYEWEPTIIRPPQAMFNAGTATMKIYNQHHRLRTPGQAKESEVIVHRPNGDIVMIFKDPQISVAQALNKRNYMFKSIFGGIHDARSMNDAVIPLSYMTNFLKATMTSWNVVFPFTNFLRDAPEAALTQLIKGEHGHNVILNYHRAFPSLVRFMRGKLNLNDPNDVELLNFYRAGGATGFTHPMTSEDAERKMMVKMERMLGRGTVRGAAVHYGQTLVEAVSMWNQLFEDATRFSVYLTSRGLGKTIEDSAYDAKEASINMNRKAKSSKFFDAIYAFWNVAWQSLQKNFKLAKDFPKRFSQVALAWMVLGFLDSLLNYSTDDEDEESKYYNINPWMRENYLIIPNLPKILSGEPKGPKYLSIPLPHFWRGFKSIGSLLFDVINGQIEPGEAIRKAITNFGAAMSPIDIGGFWSATGEFSIAPLIPTVAKPFYEISQNRNYMGFTIAREPFDKRQEKLLAEARLGKDNVNPAAKFFTDLLFRWGGGDNATKFYTDDMGMRKKVWSENLPKGLINPSYVEHIFKGVTGGTGTVVSDLMTTIGQTINPEEEVNFRNVPFINRFIRMTPESKWRIMSEYYKLKEGVTEHKALKKEYKKKAEAGLGEEQIAKTEGSAYYETYQDILDSYDKDISDMSAELDFKDTEGTKPMWDLMQQCINDIKALKQEYKVK